MVENFPCLSFANATWTSAILAALGLTVIAYLIGDQLILCATNNTIATIADAVIAAFYLWAVASWLDWLLSFGEYNSPIPFMFLFLKADISGPPCKPYLWVTSQR
ncbi:DUF2512 family protein [Brevibacillus sp. 179-C 1.1 NHS]|uniref:DUF2512 family protein n=1 Tax=Brevibacillus sp. 179-C 1.1 NHS TaxID=3235177 RepID=UPI0039A3C88C